MSNSITSFVDNSDYMRLGTQVRNEVDAWCELLQGVRKPIQESLAQIAQQMGVSLQTARRKYDAWRKIGWRGLINRAKEPEVRSALSPEFIAYWRMLCSENGRKNLPAYRVFVREFLAGTAIPGIALDVPRTHIPRGYSYDNLRLHAPTPGELAAARQGLKAHDNFRPLVFTTRVGLEVGQFYIFDDLWHDFEIVAPGKQRDPMRLLQLHGYDLFSGDLFAHGCKPRLKREDGSRTNLTEGEMLFLVAHILGNIGYRANGCTLVVEAGTATLAEALAKLLYDLSAGKILVHIGATSNAAAFAGQYAGASKGNFKLKAHLETLGNLLHNETANLLEFPGQTGSNSRINMPEELVGRERYARTLALAWHGLPPHIRTQLRHPFMEVNAAIFAVNHIIERMNHRTDHELEGFKELGLTAVDYLVPGVGTLSGDKILSLDEARRQAVLAVAEPVPRMLSPREVFNSGRAGLVKFRPEQVARLLAAGGSKEVVVGKDHVIRFEDENVGPGILRFLGHHWSPGTKFSGVVNPFSPDVLHLFDAAGRWLGVTPAWGKVSKADDEALAEKMKDAAKIQSELLGPVAANGRRVLEQKIEITQHNSDVIKGAKAEAQQEEDDTDEALRRAMR